MAVFFIVVWLVEPAINNKSASALTIKFQCVSFDNSNLVYPAGQGHNGGLFGWR